MKTPTQAHSNRFSSPGFSLVEVVLAVGIMALGVVTILGLLPHGMELSRQTANELAENRIVDALIGDAQAMEWSSLESEVKGEGPLSKGSPISKRGNWVFDDQGLLILSNNLEEAQATASYVAKVVVPTMDVQLPTNAGSSKLNNNGRVGSPNLRRVVVMIAPVPIIDFDFANPPPGVEFKTFTQLVAKMR